MGESITTPHTSNQSILTLMVSSLLEFSMESILFIASIFIIAAILIYFDKTPEFEIICEKKQIEKQHIYILKILGTVSPSNVGTIYDTIKTYPEKDTVFILDFSGRHCLSSENLSGILVLLDEGFQIGFLQCHKYLIAFWEMLGLLSIFEECGVKFFNTRDEMEEFFTS